MIELLVRLKHEAKVVPCPFCGETDSHRGTCELSNMQTGKWYAVVAIALDQVPDEEVPGD